MSEDEPAETAPETDSAAPPATSRPVGRLVLGGLLVLVGVLWLLDAAAVVDLRWRMVLPAALLAVGVALLATARREAHGGLVTAGIVLSVLVLASSLGPGVSPLAGVGERTERPSALTAQATEFELGVGKLTVDLRDVSEPPDGAEVSASLGMGELVVRLPAGVGAEVRATAGAGEVMILGSTRSGVGVSAAQTVPGTPTLVLDLSVGMGKVEVRR